MSTAHEATAELGCDGRPLPSLSDGWMRALLALALVLQVWSWSRVDGYLIADSVEFMERAQTFVRGEELIDASAIRPYGFSFALMPFYLLADWMGLTDLRPLVWAVTLLEMALGLLLVLLSARVAARIGGRPAALATGLLVAVNPVFLQFSTQPESGIPAGVCLALALERLLVRGSFRRALAGGLWLGLAFLVAFKTLVVALALLGCFLLLDRWRHRARWGGILAGLGLALGVQGLLDLWIFGRFGASLVNYLAQNAGGVLTSIFLKIHDRFYSVPSLPMPEQQSWALDFARHFYQAQSDLTGQDWAGPSDLSVRGLVGPWFYVTDLPTMLVWPAIALLALGALRALRWRAGPAWILLVAFVANVVALSNKGQKEFRLWLPLLPLLLPLCGLGWAWLAEGLLARRAGLRALAATTIFVAAAVLGLRELTGLNVRQFGGYWDAIDWVGARARETLPARVAQAERWGLERPERLRVAVAYHWAVYERHSPLLEVVKLSWQLNLWKRYPPADPAEPAFVRQHADDLADLEEVDLFVVHLPVLSNHPELLRWVAVNFEAVAAFHDQATYGDLGPILVLERHGGDPRARTLLVERHGAAADRFLAGRELAGGAEFADLTDPAGDRLELLGVDWRAIPPRGFAWVTYHWRAPARPAADWTLVDRLTAPDERNVWDGAHRGAAGALPTDAWIAGAIVSEGHLVIPAAEPYRPGAPRRPIGGAYRRGDLIPVRLWMGVRRFGAPPEGGGPAPVERELAAVRPGTREPRRSAALAGQFELGDGSQFSADGLLRILGFLLPVMPEARLEDDGRPVPE